LKYLGFFAIGCFTLLAVCLAAVVWRLPSVQHLADPKVNLTIQVQSLQAPEPGAETLGHDPWVDA
jgi:hypothetical protein